MCIRDRIWDEVLSAGRAMYATAVDDSHHFDEFISSRAAGSALSNPGKAWIMVRARELSVPSLIAAMNAGDFYATTGVSLSSYESSGKAIRVGFRDSSSFSTSPFLPINSVRY